MKGGGGGKRDFGWKRTFAMLIPVMCFFPQLWDTHNFLTPPKDLFPLCSLNSRSI